jgi:hypothetical protein
MQTARLAFFTSVTNALPRPGLPKGKLTVPMPLMLEE